MRYQKTVTLPGWALSAQEVDTINLPPGFLKDFIDYVNLCTDAPKSFALGTGLGILAVACGRCSLEVKSDKPGQEGNPPIRLWQALIGGSGQRKSKVMDLGIGLLEKTGSTFLLSDDGSVEAWHDTFADQPISLLHQDELSGLFDAQVRSYSKGLQSWLLSMWSGSTKSRSTKANGTIKVERPRLSILGAIPPDVFFKKTGSLDWKSGFLPRFLYWGGVREEWSTNSVSAPLQENALAEHLRQVCLNSDGSVIIPHKVSKTISEWFYENIELKSPDMIEDTYAGLLRLQEVGYVVAGLIALSRTVFPVTKNKDTWLTVTQSDADTTVQILELCKRTIESISKLANKDAQSVEEDSLLEFILCKPDGVTIQNVVDKIKISYKAARIRLMDLQLSGLLTSSNDPCVGRGRPVIRYKALSFDRSIYRN